MPKPFHIIATPDDKGGYSISVPENPNIAGHVESADKILPCAAALMEADDKAQAENKKLCPKCGKEYSGYSALSRTDNKTEICSVCGTREALDAFGIVGEKKEEIIARMQDGMLCDADNEVIPTPWNTAQFDMEEAKERLKDPQVQAEIKAILNGKGDE